MKKNIKFWKHINMYTIRIVARTLWIDLSMYLNYGLIILMQHENFSFVMKNTSDTCPVSKYELPTPSEHRERADWNLERFWMHFATNIPGWWKNQKVMLSMEIFKINIFCWKFFYSKDMDLLVVEKNNPGP